MPEPISEDQFRVAIRFGASRSVRFPLRALHFHSGVEVLAGKCIVSMSSLPCGAGARSLCAAVRR